PKLTTTSPPCWRYNAIRRSRSSTSAASSRPYAAPHVGAHASSESATTKLNTTSSDGFTAASSNANDGVKVTSTYGAYHAALAGSDAACDSRTINEPAATAPAAIPSAASERTIDNLRFGAGPKPP